MSSRKCFWVSLTAALALAALTKRSNIGYLGVEKSRRESASLIPVDAGQIMNHLVGGFSPPIL